MKSIYKLSNSDENLVAKMRTAISVKCASDFENLVQKNKRKAKFKNVTISCILTTH